MVARKAVSTGEVKTSLIHMVVGLWPLLVSLFALVVGCGEVDLLDAQQEAGLFKRIEAELRDT